MMFQDRKDAGRRLAEALGRYGGEDPLVLGLPRGGVPVAFEVARALRAPLDVWIVRKIGAPSQPELGLGAVSESGALFLDRKIAEAVGATETEIARIVKRGTAEVERRVRRFRHGRPAPDVRGRTVILVDDGIATGGTVRAALLAVRRLAPRRLVLAVPVGAHQTVESLRPEVDDLVCLHAPADLGAIGAFCLDFRQTDEDDVVELLERARREHQPEPVREKKGIRPAHARGGWGGDGEPALRYPAPHRTIAARHGMGEQSTRDAEAAHRIFRGQHRRRRGPGRGRRLAGPGGGGRLAGWTAGPGGGRARAGEGADPSHRGRRGPSRARLNRSARRRLRVESEVAIVPGAMHLFEEPGALEKVAALAAGWFTRHLAAPPPAPPLEEGSRYVPAVKKTFAPAAAQAWTRRSESDSS